MKSILKSVLFCNLFNLCNYIWNMLEKEEALKFPQKDTKKRLLLLHVFDFNLYFRLNCCTTITHSNCTCKI